MCKAYFKSLLLQPPSVTAYRQLTIPPVDTPLLNTYQDLIYPITVPLFILLTKKKLGAEVEFLGGLPIWLVTIIAGGIVSMTILLTVKKRDYKPRPRYVSALKLTLISIVIPSAYHSLWNRVA